MPAVRARTNLADRVFLDMVIYRVGFIKTVRGSPYGTLRNCLRNATTLAHRVPALQRGTLGPKAATSHFENAAC
jgi:hypothetical protein